MDGIVIYYNADRGLGTLLGKDGNYYFVHYSQIRHRSYQILYVREEVSFDIERIADPSKNDKAVNIVPKGEVCDISLPIEKNPFNLGPINKPEEFAGRKQIIKQGVTALLNSNNILVVGSRGMGKSSLANQFCYIAQGANFLIDKLGIKLREKLDYGVVSIRAFTHSNINNLAGTILTEIVHKFRLDVKEEINEEIDLSYYKIKVKQPAFEFSSDALIESFNYDLMKVYDSLRFEHGILIFVDEVENIDPDSGFANFVKNVTEHFATERRKITFMLSGIPSAITNRFLQHPSFLRLFTPLEVGELSQLESHELIDIYMKKTTKQIEKNAKSLMCRISRGYPVNLQLTGFYAFQMDTNNFIDSKDIDSAQKYIIDQIKSREFDSKHERVGHGLAEKILKFAVANRGDVSWPDLEGMATESELSDALEVLVNHEILFKQRKGHYFIRDHLFFLYLEKYYRGSSSL